MSEKAWYQSRTIWANILFIVLFIVNTLLNKSVEAEGLTELSTALAGGVVAAINIFLRFITTKPIGKRKK